MSLDLNPMITGCMTKIFKDFDGGTALKLVEEYIYENNYTTLGRAYARNVNVIKLTREEKYESVPRNMMEKYVETRVDVANPTINFEDLANAWRGFSGLTADGRIADPENPTQPATSGTDKCYILSEAEEIIAKAGGLETGTATIKSTNGAMVYFLEKLNEQLINQTEIDIE